MKKVLLLLLLNILFFFHLPSVSKAQVSAMPGVTCGMAGGTGGSDSCCYFPSVDLPEIPFWVPDPFGAKDDYNQKVKNLKKMQEQTRKACVYGDPSTTNIADPACKCKLSTVITPIPAIGEMCKKYLQGNELTACMNCANGQGLWTGVGCVPVEFSSFITDFLLRIGIGFAGLFALLCIIYSAIQMQLSQANPEKIKKAQEMLTSCIMGLILIIFAVFLLRVIGVNLLKIPGFMGN